MDPLVPPLQRLPDELLHGIFEYLPHSSLYELSRVCHWAHSHTIPLLWKDLVLVDRWAHHPGHDNSQETVERGVCTDEHDDTPIVKVLFVLAKNPYVASKVRTLTHRCHLPTPGIFTELPFISFKGDSLSCDPRTKQLLQLAIRNLVNVHTLRIIFGHWNLTLGLLHGFLDPNRPQQQPLRRLWLESCSLNGLTMDFMRGATLEGLESIRLRRLRILDNSNTDLKDFSLARGGHLKNLCNGTGGYYATNVVYESSDARKFDARDRARVYDDRMYKSLPDVRKFLRHQGVSSYNTWGQQAPPTAVTAAMLTSARLTLTSLNLDWLLWKDRNKDDFATPYVLLEALSRLKFPNLAAFQLRNAVVEGTRLPPDIYLLESGENSSWHFLDFMEAHPKLKCLAWPMDRFFSHKKPSWDIEVRSRAVIVNLARTLVDLRVDSHYISAGEPFTDELITADHFAARIRRRRFIIEFAAHMAKVEHLKMEGGIPRDEKRETIRALHFSPLQRIIFIGVSSPIGNSWGEGGRKLLTMPDTGNHMFIGLLEEEDEAAIAATAVAAPSLETSFRFAPFYGWPPGPPLIHTLAVHHAASVTELKFCGYNGAPVLYTPTPITDFMLHPLRHFHNLQQLVLSMWLVTYFERAFRDDEIISYWLNSRDPSSKALTLASGSSELEDIHDTNAWAERLEQKYHPTSMAEQVAKQIGPHLSEKAKARKGGVKVRGSFCLGITTGDIFDLEVRIGTGNVVLSHAAPREEAERERTSEKLESRRWF